MLLALLKFLAARTALAKCPSENWTSGLQKMAIIRALSLEFSRMQTLTVGNVAQIDVAPILAAISMTCWRTKRDSNWRYNSENISLRCRPNFRSCVSKWPVEKNPQ